MRARLLMTTLSPLVSSAVTYAEVYCRLDLFIKDPFTKEVTRTLLGRFYS